MEFRFSGRQDIAFIVYQMGKVGSSTIQRSLKETYGSKWVLHTHDHETAKEYIEKWGTRCDALIVITGFREPLARCISAYFQNLTNPQNHWYVGKKKQVKDKSVEWLINDFNAKAVPHIQNRIGPWLQDYERTIQQEMKDFPKEQGYQKASSDNVHFYVYKLESMTKFYEAMSDDPHLSKLKLVNSNKSEEKWYVDLYREFKKEFLISKSDYDAIYGNIGFVRRFYDEDELRNLTGQYLRD